MELQEIKKPKWKLKEEQLLSQRFDDAFISLGKSKKFIPKKDKNTTSKTQKCTL